LSLSDQVCCRHRAVQAKRVFGPGTAYARADKRLEFAISVAISETVRGVLMRGRNADPDAYDTATNSLHRAFEVIWLRPAVTRFHHGLGGPVNAQRNLPDRPECASAPEARSRRHVSVGHAEGDVQAQYPTVPRCNRVLHGTGRSKGFIWAHRRRLRHRS
jgi:hypothetical protein